ncbi:hypothetical protein Fmac_020762 [Flemingia macrophylla]|uniref:Agamous-like MADS-box protein AGL62 n=1 Tax=Flemingia macrophylla TaxID=520843 RepID=A0ABD1LWQ8_9FABA
MDSKNVSNMNGHELCAHLAYLCSQFTEEKKREKELNHLLKTAEGNFWWARPIDKMNKAQLEKFKATLLNLKTDVDLKREKLLNPHHFVGATSSPIVNNTVIVHQQPLLGNHVINESVSHHHQFNNMTGDAHEEEHGTEPTFRFL